MPSPHTTYPTPVGPTPHAALTPTPPHPPLHCPRRPRVSTPSTPSVPSMDVHSAPSGSLVIHPPLRNQPAPEARNRNANPLERKQPPLLIKRPAHPPTVVVLLCCANWRRDGPNAHRKLSCRVSIPRVQFVQSFGHDLELFLSIRAFGNSRAWRGVPNGGDKLNTS